MSQPPRGLGRGLSAILGDISGADDLRKPVTYQDKNKVGSPVSPRTTADVFRVPTSQISPNPYQPRLSFDSEELEGLAASIRTLGLITPITVRKIAENRYQIISGERRYRACQMVGMTEIPAYIRETDDQGMLEMAIVENVQRENLDPIEVALSYQRLLTECNLTQEQMADRLGKNRSSVANQIRLLKLPVKVQHDLKVGQISVGHAKVLLSIDDPDLQSKLCDYTIKNALNVRQLEQKVKALLAKDNAPAEKPKAVEGASMMPELHKDLCREVAKYFKGKISLKRNDDGKGSITINFSSDAEVNRFLDAIKNS
ncbi:MAG: ParB/RepB/Spo0J family partition protein [Bacteroidales bacterium]|nr:ParB/RepB/Spo0J family partition protein [Bacteroidales bacterium]